jgi:hypothetical protein
MPNGRGNVLRSACTAVTRLRTEGQRSLQTLHRVSLDSYIIIIIIIIIIILQLI